jgi:hypothetical protein
LREASLSSHDGQELVSAKVKAVSRTYFIDVQRAGKLWGFSASDLAEIQLILKEPTECA